MADPVTIPGNLIVTGNFRAGGMTLPTNSIGDGQVNVGSPITTEKLYHRYNASYGQDLGGVVVAKRRIAHIAKAAGTIVELKITLAVACTGSTSYVKCDIRKNGTTITSAPASHIPGDSAYATGAALGTFSSSAFAAGDKLEFDITVSAGDGAIGQGLYAQLVVNEPPA